jgi:capsule polysaccharide export protein KpsE/RkpR
VEDSRQHSVLPEIEDIPDIQFSPGRRPRESVALPSAEHHWTSYGWLLLAKREFIYKSVLRALLVSTVIALLIPSKFESTARIMPPEQADGGTLLALLASRGSGGSGSGSSGLGAMAGNLLGMKTTGALFVDLLRSRTVEDSIVEKFSLQKVYWARYKDDARKTLDERTVIDEDRKSGTISISVTDRDRQRSHDLAQTYLASLDALLANVSTSSARRERIFIEQRLAAVKTDLEDAERQFSAFASKNTALDIKEQGKAMVEAAAILQGQLIAAQSELQGLEQIYTGNNVRVRSLRARVAELQNQIQKFGGTDASLTPEGAAVSKDLYPSIRELPLLGVEWADLYRRVKIQETVYELLNQQYELTRIQEAKEIPTVRVVDPPNVPERRSWPPRLLIIAGLTSLWFVGTLLWVVMSDHWRRVDPRDPRKLLASDVCQKVREWASRQAARMRLGRIGVRPRKRSQF